MYLKWAEHSRVVKNVSDIRLLCHSCITLSKLIHPSKVSLLTCKLEIIWYLSH